MEQLHLDGISSWLCRVGCVGVKTPGIRGEGGFCGFGARPVDTLSGVNTEARKLSVEIGSLRTGASFLFISKDCAVPCAESCSDVPAGLSCSWGRRGAVCTCWSLWCHSSAQ